MHKDKIQKLYNHLKRKLTVKELLDLGTKIAMGEPIDENITGIRRTDHEGTPR